MENKMQTDTPKHQYLCSGMNWTLYYVEVIWFWTSRQLGSCVGLKPSNLTLGLLVTHTEEMKSLCRRLSIPVHCSSADSSRKWKPKCPSAYVTIQKMSSTVEEHYLATKKQKESCFVKAWIKSEDMFNWNYLGKNGQILHNLQHMWNLKSFRHKTQGGIQLSDTSEEVGEADWMHFVITQTMAKQGNCVTRAWHGTYFKWTKEFLVSKWLQK